MSVEQEAKIERSVQGTSVQDDSTTVVGEGEIPLSPPKQAEATLTSSPASAWFNPASEAPWVPLGTGGSPWGQCCLPGVSQNCFWLWPVGR